MDLDKHTIHVNSLEKCFTTFSLVFEHVLCVYVKHRVIIATAEICLDEKAKMSMNLIII